MASSKNFLIPFSLKKPLQLWTESGMGDELRQRMFEMYETAGNAESV